MMTLGITRFAFTVSSLATLVAGCSAAGGTYEEYEEEEVVSLEEALSATNESCDTATADVVHTGDFRDPRVTSPSTYGSSSCAWGFLVDANDYSDIETPSGAWPYSEGNTVSINDVSAGSEAECERLRVMTYVWRKNSNGSTTYLGSKSAWGEWVSWGWWCDEQGQNCVEQFVCDYPEVELNDHFSMTEGLDYRIAVSARRYSTPGGPGSFSLREVLLWNWSYREPT